MIQTAEAVLLAAMTTIQTTTVTIRTKTKIRSADGEKPAPDKTGKDMCKKIERDLGSDARKDFHDMKERGAPDRSFRQLTEDARDVYSTA